MCCKPEVAGSIPARSIPMQAGAVLPPGPGDGFLGFSAGFLEAEYDPAHEPVGIR